MGIVERKLKKKQIADSFIGWLGVKKAAVKDVGWYGKSSPGNEGAGASGGKQNLTWCLSGRLPNEKLLRGILCTLFRRDS